VRKNPKDNFEKNSERFFQKRNSKDFYKEGFIKKCQRKNSVQSSKAFLGDNFSLVVL